MRGSCPGTTAISIAGGRRPVPAATPTSRLPHVPPRPHPLAGRCPTQPPRCDIVAVLTATMSHRSGYYGAPAGLGAGEHECYGTSGTCGAELPARTLMRHEPLFRPSRSPAARPPGEITQRDHPARPAAAVPG